MKKRLSQKPQMPKNSFNFYWIYAAIVVVLIFLQFFSFTGEVKKIAMGKFQEDMLKKKQVERIVVVNGEIAEIYIKKDSLALPQYEAVRTRSVGGGINPGPHYEIKIVSVESFVQAVKEAQKDFPAQEQIYPEKDTRTNWFEPLSTFIIPMVIIIIIWMIVMRRMAGGAGGGQLFNIGKSKAQLFDKDIHVSITFNDVAGLEGAKMEIKEIVDFLKNSKKYTELGAKIPKGALLVGPPGTGKTLLAKAVAGEAKVPFFSLSGSDFVEMFVGVGASRVRDLFRQAKEKSPCIIFIDEIDAIGRARGKSPVTGANDERESTLNQLLTEMDGFGTNSGVIILAATNRADVLDRALLRAGRFDRQIYVDMPDMIERKEIFKVHLKPIKIDTTVDVDFLAKQTPGFSGADIANVCNEAALIAARHNKKLVDRQDFLDAVDRIIGGLEKRNKIISVHEKKVIAFHEAGHATVSWLLEHASPLVKVTIVPRGRSLGAAWYLPEERQITTTEQMFDEICAALGGRAAEDIVFGKISTGALSDLEKITKQAYAMVVYYGLNPKIGNISYYDSTGQSEYSFTKPYSEKTGETIDEEVSKLIDAAYKRTKEILIKHKEQLSQLAQLLLDKEVIFKEDLERIFGVRPFQPDEKVSSKSASNDTNGSAQVQPSDNGATTQGSEVSNPSQTEKKPVQTEVQLSNPPESSDNTKPLTLF
ncbi:MAG: ATP-dependent zinc metalloprotease FtsH [Bacteroidia bacterium]|nr:ATP-dependent zinc metalloprotease FtsH [Bacteroidia bacterium]